MALVSFGGQIFAPECPMAVATAPNFATTTVDADAEGVGIIFEAPVTGTITGFGAMTGALTTGDANTVFRLETVDLTATPGVPSGTLAAVNTSGIVNVAASNTWYDGVLTAGYNATQGELLAAIVQRPASGALNTVFNMFPDDSNPGSPIGLYGLPYSVMKTGASWAVGSGAPVFAINYGGTYYPIRGAWPFSAAFTAQSFNSGSGIDVFGNIWIPRFKCRVTGFWVWVDLDAAAQVKLYDTDGVTVLAQATLAANARGSTSGGVFFVPFDDALGAASVTPAVGSTYYIGVEPTTTTNMALYGFTVANAARMDALGLGQNMYRVSAKDPSGTGSWTPSTDKRMFLGVIIDQFDDGVSAAGGAYPVVGRAPGVVRAA